MRSNVNQEVVNDTAKLMMHRLVARGLARDPSLVDRAKASAAQIAERYPDRDFVRDWNKLLELSADQLRSRLTSRDPEMYRLRLSSPFVRVEGFGFTDQRLRRRIRQAAKRVAERRTSRAAFPQTLTP